MQNKLLDLNGKSSSYFLDDIDNDKHDEYGKNNHEYLAYHPVIPASTIVNLHRQTILQNFMDSWLDPDEESEHNDNSNSIYDHNNNNQSEEKDQVKTPDIHIGVPGPLGEMYFHNNIDSDDDFFNGRDNEDDEKDENDELEEGKDNIHSRGYFNIEEDDDDDDDEEDLKSPIQIKQQHSSKQSIINTSSSTPLLHNDSNKLTGGEYDLHRIINYLADSFYIFYHSVKINQLKTFLKLVGCKIYFSSTSQLPGTTSLEIFLDPHLFIVSSRDVLLIPFSW